MCLLSDHIPREPSICVCYPIISGATQSYVSAIRSYPARTNHISRYPIISRVNQAYISLSDHIRRGPSICRCYPIISRAGRAYVAATRSYPARTDHIWLLSDHIPREPIIYLAIRSYPDLTDHMSLLPDHIRRQTSI